MKKSLNYNYSMQEKKENRGRKKKQIDEFEIVPDVKEKKKRGRKAVIKYYSSNIRNKILSNDVKNDLIIIQIPDVIDNTSNSECVFDELLNNNKEIPNSEDLRKLYEKQINIRKEQDDLLISQLENADVDDVEIAIDTLKHGKIASASTTTNNLYNGYFQILSVLEDKWIGNNDLYCWNCAHTFDNNIYPPIGIPIEYIKKDNKYRTRGYFCSEACMYRYLTDYNIASKYKSNVHHLHSLLTGDSIANTRIDLAPPKESLIQFGGKLTIDEYRSNQKTIIYKMIEFPMVISRDYIEEIDLCNVKKANTQLFDNNNTDNIAPDVLGIVQNIGMQSVNVSQGNTQNTVQVEKKKTRINKFITESTD